jgi:hypothetical protein
MVNGCGAEHPNPAVVSAQWSNTAPDAQQQAIGVANQAIVHRLMSSLAVLPFSQALG